MIYGYCRISTNHQQVCNQRHEIQTFADKNNIKIDKWIEETISSKEALTNRKLGKILKKLKKGDILIASELSRLGRNLLEVMGILQNCLEKDCQIWTLKENYRLGNDIQSKVLAFAFGLAAEIERNLISQRTKSSLANLKAIGKKLGRPLAAESQKLKLSKNSKKIRNLLSKGISKSQIAKILGVQRSTLRRFIERNNYSN
jgi:DNA invertase Pin-like site-specific DNA recombinase